MGNSHFHAEVPWKETTMTDKRTEFALRALQPGVNFSELCEEYGISRKTGYKWAARFEARGAAGMADASRRPRSSPGGLGEDVVCEIARLHQAHPAWGPRKIRELYARARGEAPSESSFKRVFEKCGWVRKRRRRRSAETGRIRSGTRAAAPNEVWTVDFKGWWLADGERCEPLTVRDEYSRYVLEVRAMATASGEAVRAVFEELFRRHGLPGAIRSDNGSPFAARSAALGLSRLSAWWVALGVSLERGRPGKPQDNGAHERMHRDIRDELEGRAGLDARSRQAAFDTWRRCFNEERPHEALGMRTPAELYRNSGRPYEGTPEDIAYEGMRSRRVDGKGMVKVDGTRIALSAALSGWSVGLKACGRSAYEVHFGKLLIGHLDVSTASFVGAASGPKEGGAHGRTMASQENPNLNKL
jgi:putative transposase